VLSGPAGPARRFRWFAAPDACWVDQRLREAA
jgi:hypothetical protein